MQITVLTKLTLFEYPCSNQLVVYTRAFEMNDELTNAKLHEAS